MIWMFLCLQLAMLVLALLCRRRASVLQTLVIHPSDSPGVRMFVRRLSDSTRFVSALDRMLAAKLTAVTRAFVRTSAFDQMALAAVAHVRRRQKKARY